MNNDQKTKLNTLLKNQLAIMITLRRSTTDEYHHTLLDGRREETVELLDLIDADNVEAMQKAGKLYEEELGPVPRTKSEQLEICRNCTAIHGSSCKARCGPYSIYVKRITENLKGLTNLTSGDKEPYVGKAPCQTCGDTNDGDRYEIRADRTESGETEELAVCTDCFGYFFT